MTANRIFGINFDRNNIKSCGFHRSREAVSLHSSILYSTISVDHQMVPVKSYRCNNNHHEHIFDYFSLI